jgi:hypothetical protein
MMPRVTATLAENVAAITIAFFGQPLAAETLQVIGDRFGVGQVSFVLAGS